MLWPAEDVRLDLAGRDIVARAGDLVMIDRDQSVILTGSDTWTARLLNLCSRASSFAGQLRCGNITVFDGTTPLAQILKRAWTMGDDIHQCALNDEPTDGRLLELIGELARRLLSSEVDGTISAHGSAMVQRAKLLIAAHCGDPAFSAGGLAQRMRVSPRYLSALFAAVGTTPTNAIIAQRLAHAKSLLADPNGRGRRIASIALDSGFADPNYFTRRFAREYGVAPNEFRFRTIQQH